jgi:hypothetical protein
MKKGQTLQRLPLFHASHQPQKKIRISGTRVSVPPD